MCGAGGRDSTVCIPVIARSDGGESSLQRRRLPWREWTCGNTPPIAPAVHFPLVQYPRDINHRYGNHVFLHAIEDFCPVPLRRQDNESAEREVTVVCITGMRCSGASPVARALHRCGLFLGRQSDLPPATDEDPEAGWEHRGFHDLNDRILSALGGGRDLPPDPGPDWEQAPELEACRKEAGRLIRAMEGRGPWGWKGPSNCLTLPFWRQLLPDLKVVICLRSPQDVARSLARCGRSPDFSFASLWCTCYERLLAAVPESNRLLTHFDAYAHDPESELRRVLSFLGLPQDAEKIQPAAGWMRPGPSAFPDRAEAGELPQTDALYDRLCLQAGPVYADFLPRETEPVDGEGDGSDSDLAGRAEKAALSLRSLQDRLHVLGQSIQYLSSRLEEGGGAQGFPEGQLKEKDGVVQAFSAPPEGKARESREFERRKSMRKTAAESLTMERKPGDESILALTKRLEEKERAERTLNDRIREAERQRKELSRQLAERNQAAEQLFRELEEIKGGTAWVVFTALHKARASFIPYGSRRERIWHRFTNGFRIWRKEGFAALLRRTLKKPAPPAAPQQRERTADSFRQVYADRIRMLHRRDKGRYVPISAEDFDPRAVRVKAIAFYRPHFYPIPETDEQRGRGYTEWTDVSKAAPNFLGQYQPRLPGELGFYDLRLPEIQKRQVELAKKYGIHGFCFQYYWFAGRRMWDLPLALFLDQRETDFPFCVCWSNGNVTRRRVRAERIALTARVRSEGEFGQFIRDLLPALRDSRYIRVDGKPLLIIDDADSLPDPGKAAELMRTETRRNGISGLYLIAAQPPKHTDPRPRGFDAVLECPPLNREKTHTDSSAAGILHPQFSGAIFDYAKVMESATESAAPKYPLYRTVFPSWDDTPRHLNAAVTFIHSTPERYKEWLRRAAELTRRHLPPDRRFVFINAWNGWGDGAYLEPDRLFGYAYLQATAEALTVLRTERPVSPSRWTILFVSHDANQGGAQGILLNTISWFVRHTSHRILVLCLSGGGWLSRFERLAETTTIDTLRGGETCLEDGVLLDRLRAFCGGTPDLVYGNTVVAGRAFAWLSKLETPILAHILELEMSIRHYARKEWMADIPRLSAGCIACSKAVRDNLVARHAFAPDRIDVCYPGVHPDPVPAGREEGETARIRNTLGLESDKLIVFGCGLGMPFRKGADLFIELARLLREKGFDGFHLYWIGALDDVRDDPRYGNWRDHLDLSTGSELGTYVTFLGLKENPRAYMRAGDAFVLTSREEPFGLVALEAADCGLPIVCFDNAGAADFVGEDAGFIVPAEDVRAMAEKLGALLSDSELRRRMGMRAREKIHHGFTVDQATRRVSAVCRRTAGKEPAVSVIVPNYNHANYLPERLESIFRQTLQDFEVILLDDASTDDSLKVMERYADRGDVRILRNERNSGAPFPQWLKGIDAARADVLWIAESDDRCEPEFLERLLPAFADPDIRLVYANSHIIDERGTVTGDYMDSPYLTDLSPTKWRSDYTVTAEQEINDGLGIKDTILNASAVLFRKFEPEEDFRRMFAGMRTVGDWLFFARAIRGGKVRYDARKLNFHRRHAGSVIGRILKTKKLEQFFRDFYETQKFIFDQYSLDDDFPRKWEAYLRQQWDDFHPGGTLGELEKYFPFNEMKERLLENVGRRTN
jgi:glycosyltransferase involved in cell wall biosynthesis